MSDLGLTTLHLLDEGILNGTGVGVQESRGFSTEVLKNLKAVVRDLAQVSYHLRERFAAGLRPACCSQELLHLAGGVMPGLKLGDCKSPAPNTGLAAGLGLPNPSGAWDSLLAVSESGKPRIVNRGRGEVACIQACAERLKCLLPWIPRRCRSLRCLGRCLGRHRSLLHTACVGDAWNV